MVPRIAWVLLFSVAAADYDYDSFEGEDEDGVPVVAPEPAPTPAPIPKPTSTRSPIPVSVSQPRGDNAEERHRRLTQSALDSAEAQLTAARIPFKKSTWQYCNFQLDDHPNLKSVKSAVDCAAKCTGLTNDCTHWTYDVAQNTCHIKRCMDTTKDGYEEDLFGWLHGTGPAHPENTGRQLKDVDARRARTDSKSSDL